MASETHSAGARTYGNFHNPFGLILRMLRSGQRAARTALGREAMRILLTPVDLMLSAVERRTISAEQPGQQPLILIVGPPRCGTTLVYQVLARYCDVTCLTNLSSLFPRSPLTAVRWFGPRTTARSNRMENYYGQTAGLHDPNDGFHVWNRWLGADRYRTPEQLPAETVVQMTRFFQAWTSVYPRPFLNKNNRNADCVRLLASHLPTAVFIVIRRDFRAAARSLIRARLEVQGDRIHPWGLRSRQLKCQDDPLGYVDDVCDQLKEIESRLSEQLEQVPGTRQLAWSYEEFCEDPRRCLNELAAAVPSLQLKQTLIDTELRRFPCSSGRTLSGEEEERLTECLNC